MTVDMAARDMAGVHQLLASIEDLSREIASQRARLRDGWTTGTERIDKAQEQLRVVDATIAARQHAYDDIERMFCMVPGRGGTLTSPPPIVSLMRQRKSGVVQLGSAVPAASIGGWLQPSGTGWAIRPEIERVFDAAHNTARSKFIAAEASMIARSLRRDGVEALARFGALISRLSDVRKQLEVEIQHAEPARAHSAADERRKADRALASAEAIASEALGRLPAALQPRTSDAWRTWNVDEPIPGVSTLYAGLLVSQPDEDLGPNSAFGANAKNPWFVSLRQNLQIIFSDSDRESALAMARSLLLRQLAAVSPGELQFCFFDPVGLGQSVASMLDLAEYDASLIGGKVWSASADLAARLAEQTSHVELVIQKYLRSAYETIDEFNAVAGETAEPYRLLVLFDFPAGFNEETMGRLKSILQNGPRCGVHTLLLRNSSVTPPYGVDLSQIGAVVRIEYGADLIYEHGGYALHLRPRPDTDFAADAALAKTIIDAVGRKSVGRSESAVTFQKTFGLYSALAGRGIRTDLSAAAASSVADDESTWWRDDSTRGLFAPIGQKGARDAAILSFDSADHSGALLVGRPGSGKSTLLHAYIAGLATLYGPDELELYLIDFKEGVEFKSYAAEGLPHARVVAIESDREFGLSVLQSLTAELARRGELLRATGGRHVGLQALREASREALPRALLVFDEFQVLFARNDRLGLTAADLLETVIRQGRGFGIHVLLGSQSLSGLDALGAHVPQLLPTRILLPATELDARRVLGDDNDAGQYLTSHGEGILNGAAGAVEANERFKGALLTEPDRIDRLRRLRAKADSAGFMRRPMVFEGNACVPLDAIQPSEFRSELTCTGKAPIRLRAGVPMAISGVADLELRREAGANVLAVLRDGDGEGAGVLSGHGLAYGLLTAAVASAAQSPARLDVIDFLPVDDGLDEVFEPFLERGRITLRRRRAFGPLAQELLSEVRDRVERDDAIGQARLMFLFGIHRARELDSSLGSIDADHELSDALEQVMRDGPEVGIHVWMWADTVSGASRRLSPQTIRECGWRIAGKMSSDDSLAFLGSERAAEIRSRQLLLANDDLGLLTRALSLGMPARDWLTKVLDVGAAAASEQEG